MPASVLIPILAAAGLQAAPPPPADAETEARYRACVAQVRADPEAAVTTANGWRIVGGGYYARQCLGLAYVALERWGEAAAQFEEAARTVGPHDPRAADFQVQAGNAWLAAGEGTRAIQAFDAALASGALTGQMRGEVRLDRARALVALGSLDGARQDLDEALRLVPEDPMAWYLSAGLARRQRDTARAAADIARARALAPDDPDVLLLAGTIAGDAGNMAEAERLYRQVASAAPDSRAGRAAREALATAREIELPAQPPPAAAAPPPPQPPAPAPHSR